MRPCQVNRLAAVTRAMNTFTPCILPSSVRQLARVATVPALTTAMGDSMPLLPGRPQDEDVDGRATSVMTGGESSPGFRRLDSLWVHTH